MAETATRVASRFEAATCQLADPSTHVAAREGGERRTSSTKAKQDGALTKSPSRTGRMFLASMILTRIALREVLVGIMLLLLLIVSVVAESPATDTAAGGADAAGTTAPEDVLEWLVASMTALLAFEEDARRGICGADQICVVASCVSLICAEDAFPPTQEFCWDDDCCCCGC